MTEPAAPLLRVDRLSVSYGANDVVSEVGFELRAGQTLALIGESGSGKSTIARAVLRLLPDGARARGTVEFQGRSTLVQSERQFRAIRGRGIGFVPQEPAQALNPVRTIGSQAHEAAALIEPRDAAARRRLIHDVFAKVGLTDPDRVAGSYPHQLSGGMLQRVLIGLAVLPEPALLVADEPTSALDVTIQKRILDLLAGLQRSLGIGLLLITHDLAIAAERSDRLVVLKGGAVQETGPTGAVFGSPASDYTVRLRADAPALNPDRYRPLRAQRELVAQSPRVAVVAVTRSFTVDGTSLTAVDGVSFAVAPGTTHALVGESGSGKTTAVRILLGLESAVAGTVRVDGEEVTGAGRAELRRIRRHLQLVYQNPYTSLDPTWRVERLVRESLDRYRVGDRRDRAERVREALRQVGLDDSHARRRPAALSGGQRQRVAIARALVLRPDVIVLDEPTSALDVSVQAEIFDVLTRLQVEQGLTYLFVSHDLALVRQLADTVSVLRHGGVVESGPVDEVFERPADPYTRALLDAIPHPGVLAAPAAESRPAPSSSSALAEPALTVLV